MIEFKYMWDASVVRDPRMDLKFTRFNFRELHNFNMIFKSQSWISRVKPK